MERLPEPWREPLLPPNASEGVLRGKARAPSRCPGASRERPGATEDLLEACLGMEAALRGGSEATMRQCPRNICSQEPQRWHQTVCRGTRVLHRLIENDSKQIVFPLFPRAGSGLGSPEGCAAATSVRRCCEPPIPNCTVHFGAPDKPLGAIEVHLETPKALGRERRTPHGSPLLALWAPLWSQGRS